MCCNLKLLVQHRLQATVRLGLSATARWLFSRQASADTANIIALVKHPVVRIKQEIRLFPTCDIIYHM